MKKKVVEPEKEKHTEVENNRDENTAEDRSPTPPPSIDPARIEPLRDRSMSGDRPRKKPILKAEFKSLVCCGMGCPPGRCLLRQDALPTDTHGAPSNAHQMCKKLLKDSKIIFCISF